MLRKLNGEEFDYFDEVEGLFGITPALVPEEYFLKIHKDLDNQFPGKGSLLERIETRDQEVTIPTISMPKAVDLIINKIRHHTNKLIPLTDGELIEIDFVSDKPFSAYNHYLGNANSLIQINLDNDYTPLFLLNVLSHEAYPGHHTELQIKERLLLQSKNFLEESCLITFTPRQLVHEGIAITGIEMISSGLDLYKWIAEELTPALNLPQRREEEFYTRQKAVPLVFSSRANAAIKYHSGFIGQEEAIEYIKTYGLVSDKLARQYFRAASDPFWSTYVFTYSEGYKLIKNAIEGEKQKHIFKRLLTEQILPEDL